MVWLYIPVVPQMKQDHDGDNFFVRECKFAVSALFGCIFTKDMAPMGGQAFKLLKNNSLDIRNLFINYSYKIEIPMNN